MVCVVLVVEDRVDKVLFKDKALIIFYWFASAKMESAVNLGCIILRRYFQSIENNIIKSSNKIWKRKLICSMNAHMCTVEVLNNELYEYFSIQRLNTGWNLKLF